MSQLRRPGDRGGGGGDPAGVTQGIGDTAQPTSDKRADSCGETSGNPVVLSTGNKVEPELDFVSGGEMGLFLQRTYNRYWSANGLFGSHWLSNFDYSLKLSSDGLLLWIQHPDGRRIKFIRDATGTRWNENKASPVAYVVQESDGTYTHHNETRGTERYTSEGYVSEVKNERGITWTFSYSGKYLQRVTHASGRYVQFVWNSGQLAQVVDPAGNIYNYTYSSNVFGASRHRLASVQLPGAPQTTVSYHYEDGRFPGALTGKSFNGVRYSFFAYDAEGRAISTEHAGNVELYTFSYGVETTQEVIPPPPPPPPGGYRDGDSGSGWCEYRSGEGRICYEPLSVGEPLLLAAGTTSATTTTTAGTKTIPVKMQVTETSPLGRRTVHHYEDGRKVKVDGLATPNCPAAYRSASYDTNGNVDLVTDFGGNQTDYDYDAHGYLLRRVDAVGQSIERRTTYGWDTSKNRLLRVTVDGDSEVVRAYTADGRIKTVTIKNLSGNGVANQSRVISYSYTKHANGLLATVAVDGVLPSDTVTSTYSQTGDLITVKNGLGHTTTYSNYNALGQPGRVTGPNGDAVEYVYDARGRITATKAIVDGVAQTTSYTYDGAGRLAAVTTPDNVTLTREYDAAGRVLREYQDEAGGTFAVKKYTYNNASQVTSVEVQRTTAVAVPSGTPSVSIASSNPDSYTVSWSASSGADSYYLHQKVDDGNWQQAYHGSSRSRSFADRPAGTYAYRAKACNAEGCAAWSSTKSVYVPPAVPSLTAPSADNNGAFSVSWNAVAGATEYRLDQRRNGGGWGQIYSGTATSKAASGLSNGTYDYRVRACNGGGCSGYSAIDTTVVTHPPSVPTVTAPAADNNGAYTVSWGAVSTATSYRLEQSKNSGSWSEIHNGSATSKAVSGLTNGSYAYRARACNAGGCSAYSAIDTTVVTFPPGSAPTLSAPTSSDTDTNFTVSWTAVSTATRYELQYAWNGGSWAAAYDGSALYVSRSHRFDGSYSYRVRACNVGGCGPFSATRTVHVVDVGGPCFGGGCPEPKSVDPVEEEY